MPVSLATSLSTILDRYVDSIISTVASEGLVLLKRVLDEAGFGNSEHLKNYEVFAHVTGHEVAFEIVLDFEAVVAEDAATNEALLEPPEDMEGEFEPEATYTLGPSGPMRLASRSSGKRDARRPARDARRPARDARTTARDRLVAKEVANITPRSARVTKDGRLSVALKRSTRTVDGEMVMPRGEFQGIIGEFMTKLKNLVTQKFSPALTDIIARNA